jgi:hypothetical protein
MTRCAWSCVDSASGKPFVQQPVHRGARADAIPIATHRHAHYRQQAQLSVDDVDVSHIELDASTGREVPPNAIIARMFELWTDIDGYPTLVPCDRPVIVDTSWLPPSGARRDKLAMWIKSGGLRIDYEMAGRQLAWVRRADGSWIAVVELTGLSGNQRSSLTATLWLPPSAIRA